VATKKIHQSNFDEISLEYSHLRQEILHNGTLNSQTLGTTIVIVGALMGFAFSEQIIYDIIKGVIFFLVAIIVLINTLQILDRERATYVIASYIHIFIESKSSDLQWESRLKKFREKSEELGYGDFITSQLIINIIFVAGNTVLGNYYLYKGIMHSASADAKITSLAIALILANSLTFYFIFRAWSRYKKYDKNHEAIYTNIWKDIKNNKTRNSNRAHRVTAASRDEPKSE